MSRLLKIDVDLDRPGNGLGPVAISWNQAKMIDFSCPSRRNKGLKPLVPHDLPTVESGFQAI